MVRGGVRSHRTAERAPIHVNAPRVYVRATGERAVRRIGGGVQGDLRCAPSAAPVARIVEDQNGGTRRLELPHDRPDGSDVLAVAIKPQEAGGGWGRLGDVAPRPINLPLPSPSFPNPPWFQVPPHELRPIARDELDPLPVLDAHPLGIGQAPPRRRKSESLLEQPGE